MCLSFLPDTYFFPPVAVSFVVAPGLLYFRKDLFYILRNKTIDAGLSFYLNSSCGYYDIELN